MYETLWPIPDVVNIYNLANVLITLNLEPVNGRRTRREKTLCSVCTAYTSKRGERVTDGDKFNGARLIFRRTTGIYLPYNFASE